MERSILACKHFLGHGKQGILAEGCTHIHQDIPHPALIPAQERHILLLYLIRAIADEIPRMKFPGWLCHCLSASVRV